MSKENHKNSESDKRINTKHFSVKVFILTYFILSVLTAGQALIYNSYVRADPVPVQYIFGMMGYWAIVTTIFALVTARQRYLAYDKPMRILSESAKKVAEGDYSVWVPPLRKDGKKIMLK